MLVEMAPNAIGFENTATLIDDSGANPFADTETASPRRSVKRPSSESAISVPSVRKHFTSSDASAKLIVTVDVVVSSRTGAGLPSISTAAPRSESACLVSVETCWVDAPINCSTSVVGFGAVVVLAEVVVVVGLVDVIEELVVDSEVGTAVVVLEGVMPREVETLVDV